MSAVGFTIALRRRIFYGWWIVAAYVALNIYWAGTLTLGLTVFFAPIRQSFGWSAALLAAIFSIENLASSLLAPAVGVIFDRRGPRALMFGATFLAGGGLLLLARTSSLPAFAVAFVILSAGFAIWSAGTGPAMAALWFQRRRGLAMGIIVSGSSLGGLLVPVWSAIAGADGWRSAVTIAGVGLLCLSLPLCLLLRHRPQAYGLAPDGARPDADTVPRAEPAAAASLAGVLRSPRFRVVAGTAAIAAMGGGATNVHILPSLREAGIPSLAAVTAVAAISLCGIPGRLAAGWMADRIGALTPLLATYALQGTGLLLLAAVRFQHSLLLPAALLFGLGSTGLFLAPSLLLVRAFGTAAFGRIQGMLLLITGLGRFLGPIIAGLLHDRAGNYVAAYVAFGLITLFAMAPVLRLKGELGGRKAGLEPS